ncbi:MAG: hypothetical protein ABNH21_00595, partial [Glaciecola sp.]
MLFSVRSLHLLACISMLCWISSAQSQSLNVNVEWRNANVEAKVIASNELGDLFYIDLEDQLVKLSHFDLQKSIMPGEYIDVHVDNQNRIWAVKKTGELGYFMSQSWTKVADGANTVYSGSDGNVVVTTNQSTVAISRNDGSTWENLGEQARAAIIRPNGDVWSVSTSGVLSQYIDGAWYGLAENALNIGLSSDGLVQLIDNNGRVSNWSPDSAAWLPVSDLTDIRAIVYSNGNSAWKLTSGNAVFGRNISGLAEDVSISEGGDGDGSTDPAEIVDETNIQFLPSVGTAQDITVGSDGSIYILNGDESVARWSNLQNNFYALGRQFSDIAALPNGELIGINEFKQFVVSSFGEWQSLTSIGNLESVSANNNSGLGVSTSSKQLYYFNSASSTPQILAGSGSHLQISHDQQQYWYLSNSQLIQCNFDSNCNAIAPNIVDFAYGPGGSLFIVDSAGMLKRRASQSSTFQIIRTENTRRVALGPNDQPWIIDENNQVLPSTFFQRDESQDQVPNDQNPGLELLVSSTKLALTRTIGSDTCDFFFGEIDISLLNGNELAIDSVNLSTELNELVAVDVLNGENSAKKTIRLRGNCLQASVGDISGKLTFIAKNVSSGEIEEVNIALSLQTNIIPLIINAIPEQVILNHQLVVDSCPSTASTVLVSTNTGFPFTINNISIDDTLVGLLDISIENSQSGNQQTLSIAFNCSELSVGNKLGEISLIVNDEVTTLTSELVIPITLTVEPEEFSVIASPLNITATHRVGVDSCPQDLASIATTISSGADFTLSNIVLSSELASVVDASVSPGGSA